MDASINLIARKFYHLVPKIFEAEYLADVIVHQVNMITNQITVESDSYVFECVTNLNISKLTIGDEIRIKFKLAPDPVMIATVRPQILFFCSRSRYKYVSKQFKKYIRIQTELNQINWVSTKKLPRTIYRIGLIVIQDVSFDKFKSEFESKCVGNLFIYKVDPINMPYDFINGINYFNKYHEIDLICILTEKLELEQLFSLSSKYVLSHTKPLPYTIACLNNGPKYLASGMVDLIINSISPIINLIQKTQIAYRIQIDQAIHNARLQSEQIIQTYKKRVFDLEFSIIDLNPHQIELANPIIKLENIATSIIENESICDIIVDDQFIEVLDDDQK